MNHQQSTSLDLPCLQMSHANKKPIISFPFSLQLPAAIRSYYQGPAARGYVTVDHDIHVERSGSPSSRYAHVESRIDSSRPERPQPEALHSELRSGSRLTTNSAAERERARSARLTPLSLNLSISAGGGDGEAQLLRSSLLTQQDAPTMMLGYKASRAEAAAAARSSAPSVPFPAEQTVGGNESDVKTVSERGGESPSLKTSKPTRIRRGAAATGEEPGAAPSVGTAPAPTTSLPSAQVDFAASMRTLLFKVYPPMGHGAHSGASGSTTQRKMGSMAGRSRVQRQQRLSIACGVKLPSAPTQMLMSSSKRSAGVIERVLLNEGYMRSDLLKILDQLKSFQK